MIKTVPEKSKVTLLDNCDKITTENRFNQFMVTLWIEIIYFFKLLIINSINVRHKWAIQFFMKMNIKLCQWSVLEIVKLTFKLHIHTFLYKRCFISNTIEYFYQIVQRINRWVDLGEIQSGLSYNQILYYQSANRFGVRRSTISRLHQRFRTTLQAEWRPIPQATIRTVRSMRRRCTSVKRRWLRILSFLKIPTVTLRIDIYEWLCFGFSFFPFFKFALLWGKSVILGFSPTFLRFTGVHLILNILNYFQLLSLRFALKLWYICNGVINVLFSCNKMHIMRACVFIVLKYNYVFSIWIKETTDKQEIFKKTIYMRTYSNGSSPLN
jgi:hypothetical protein